MLRFRSALSMLALALAACESIPTLGFTPDDGGTGGPPDATTDARWPGPEDAGGTNGYDTGSTPPDDAAIADAGSTSDAGSANDAGIVDAGPPPPPPADASCPGTTPPPGASYCCNTTPCRGSTHACSNECTNCENNCKLETCCLDHNGNYQGCATSAAACPAQ